MTISLTIPNEPTAIAAAVAFFAALQGETVVTVSSGLERPRVVLDAIAADDDDDEQSPGTGAAAATGSAKLDTKGVPFDSNFCANAADPFYGSGPRAGQWKKRKGVDDKAYDAWYEERLQDLAPAGVVRSEDDTPAPASNTAAAFSNAAPAATTTPAAPKTAGEFMGWVAEQQAANLLAQTQIQAAYAMAGLQIADLFGADAALVARNVATLYAILTQPSA